jgi:flagellar biogenesis protein FliO
MESGLDLRTRQFPGAAGMTWLEAFRHWARRMVRARKPHRLKICETLSLGERRFVAVIQVDRQEFLVGGTGQSLNLLARVSDGQILPRADSRLESNTL